MFTFIVFSNASMAILMKLILALLNAIHLINVKIKYMCHVENYFSQSTINSLNATNTHLDLF